MLSMQRKLWWPRLSILGFKVYTYVSDEIHGGFRYMIVGLGPDAG